MTPRRRAILIIALAALLLGVIIVVIILVRRAVPSAQPPAAQPVAEAPTPEQAAAAAIIQNPLAPAVTEPVGRTAAAQMGELFAERYGSYSNQGDYQNVRDLLPVMTAKYRAQTEAMLEDVEPQREQTFEGVTSVKISSEVRSYNEAAGTAVVAVTLQQEKVSGVTTTVGYRTLRMELKREGQDWRVDASRWENELTPIN
ncbi:MAG: hypothetical protein QY323_05520 [Patescibacteria group bacterium]|nr:MAG: hypothetical protein QY323_05520 [Patescibacteria group bacterium]